MLIDTHCHLDDIRYEGEREEMIQRARDAGVKRFITIGCDIELSKRARDIAELHNDVCFSAGIHPHEAGKALPSFVDELEELTKHAKCVAVGECGLDYYYDHSPRDVQRDVFLKQIELAKKMGKALTIHVRDAWDECIEILQDEKPKRVVIHCFTGTQAHAQQFLALDCYLSISGIVTFKNPGALADVVKATPLNRLLVETDAPYLAPLPHRGQRNEPAYVRLVAEKVAELKNIPYDDVVEQTGKNASMVFGLI